MIRTIARYRRWPPCPFSPGGNARPKPPKWEHALVEAYWRRDRRIALDAPAWLRRATRAAPTRFDVLLPGSLVGSAGRSSTGGLHAQARVDHGGTGAGAPPQPVMPPDAARARRDTAGAECGEVLRRHVHPDVREGERAARRPSRSLAVGFDSAAGAAPRPGGQGYQATRAPLPTRLGCSSVTAWREVTVACLAVSGPSRRRAWALRRPVAPTDVTQWSVRAATAQCLAPAAAPAGRPRLLSALVVR